MRSSSLAICSFSSAEKETPAACSPSRRVVSKIRTRSAIAETPVVGTRIGNRQQRGRQPAAPHQAASTPRATARGSTPPDTHCFMRCSIGEEHIQGGELFDPRIPIDSRNGQQSLCFSLRSSFRTQESWLVDCHARATCSTASETSLSSGWSSSRLALYTGFPRPLSDFLILQATAGCACTHALDCLET